MKVSIVTISYNQAPFIERALRSVIEQDYGNLEYIVVDPGSTDGSRTIIERYRPSINKIIYEPDRGPADGLNKGFAQATGEICAYLNADDALLSGAVGAAVREFQKDPALGVVFAHGYVADQNDRILKRCRSTRFSLLRYAFGSAVVMQPSTFFRRSAFLRTGGFNLANRTCWDGELLVNLAQNGGKFRLVNEYWSLFRVHPGSISGSGRLEDQYRRDQQRLFQKITGRTYHRRDVFFTGAARLEKWVRDPLVPILWACEKLAGPPRVTVA
jgi:glycosyltransferase involved in cell wall biosynthesis